MTTKLTQIWSSINKVLTNINLLLAMVLLQVGGDPEKVKGRKIPLLANIILLIILVSILIYFIHSYSNTGQQTSGIA